MRRARAADAKRVNLNRAYAVLIVLAAALAPSSALAAAPTGGAAPPSGSDSETGGTEVEREQTSTDSRERSGSSRASSLGVTGLKLNGSRFYEHGRPLRVSFQVTGSGGSAKLKLVFVAANGKRVKVLDLGDVAAGRSHTVSVPLTGLPSGPLQVRVSGRDTRRRLVKSAAPVGIDLRSHRFPVVGPHTFGGEDSRFGADRAGGKRKHQGQDVSAAEGTPLVAVRGGTVVHTGNQPSGAGVYLVIRGAGESRDYVYMHLVEGSLLVRQGQTVRTGQLIGKVGNTGASSGAHLHFEIWQGAWQGGGTPIDPLPLLQRWDAWS